MNPSLSFYRIRTTNLLQTPLQPKVVIPRISQNLRVKGVDSNLPEGGLFVPFDFIINTDILRKLI